MKMHKGRIPAGKDMNPNKGGKGSKYRHAYGAKGRRKGGRHGKGKR